MKGFGEYKFIFLISILYLISCGERSDIRPIGFINYDTLLDEHDFVICNDKKVFEYYNFSNAIRFTGEKPAIDKHIRQHVEYTQKPNENGYITIRFIVNCEGRAGRFRIIQLDDNYNEKHFDQELVDQILSATKSLQGWCIGQKNSIAYDYHQYLTFKIINGRIKNILP